MRDGGRAATYYAAGMVVLLVGFALLGDNGVAYVTALLGVPVVSGALAGLGLIRFWHAAVGCVAVVALDLVLDETWSEDLVFFVVLAVVMLGIAALARLVARRFDRRTVGPAH
jgi:hypothetical protein